ncbi:uncharacterized protein [Atheta coriaria]|uniref:uncharacterized protein isoform X4 n=1 Tax=Dalotia coriaria TaxID=877792 RepID=UPI0031F450D9
MWFAKRLRVMMPQDSLQLALTTGFGFSVLAGIFSGVVYIISVGYNKTKRVDKPDTPWHCSFCGSQFNSINGVLEHENVVTCMKCARTFCKEKCAKRSVKPSITYLAEEVPRQSSNNDSRRSSYSATERWICKKCQPDSWISGIVRLLQFNETKEWYTKKMTTEQAQINAELSTLQRKEREQVRDFIERLVEALLGGELDTVSVKKIYNDERYDTIFMRYHGDLSSALTDLGSALHITISSKWYLPISGESPCAAHASLKTLIQRFIREASELPELHKATEEHAAITDDNNDRTYEDLLSTAIINKVVQNYQEKPHSVAGSSSGRSKTSNDKEYFLGERNLDSSTPKFDDTSSLSSLDEYISTNGSTKYLDQMNFAIQQSIKEVSSSDEDEVDYNIDEVDSTTMRNNDWQENWYLRKRNFGSGTNSPVPVPMLVPNPNPSENAKVLIGDRDIDETSDLSDAISDYEDSAEPSSLNAVLINSKNLIGGTNPLVSMVAKAESIIDEEHDPKIIDNEEDVLEFSSFTNDNNIEQDTEIIETCNQVFNKDHFDDDNGASGDTEDQLISLESNTEKDSEYTEKYATLPRKIPMPTPRQSKLADIDFTKTSLLIEDSKTDNGDSGVTSDEDDKQKTFKGSSYGEREKDKWNHAVDLPNNPYSKSNLENRLSNRSNRSSSISSLNSYGRDYFAKAAGRPQGALKKNWIDQDDLPRDGDIADDEERKVEVVDDPIVPQENVFRAVPVQLMLDEPENTKDNVKINEDQGDDQSSIEISTPTKRLQPWDLSSDSDYSIERTYNVNSGKIIKKLGDVEYELPVTEAPSAEGLKYTKLDENQNAINNKAPPLKVVQEKRSHFLRSLTLEEEDILKNLEPVDDIDDLDTVTAPAVNHFKLVDEIINENVDQYEVEPISPPAEYKNLGKSSDHASIEYDSEEKSYDFSIESTFEEEERLKAQNNKLTQESPTIVEESLNRGIIDYPGNTTTNKNIIEPPHKSESTEKQAHYIIEESVIGRIREPSSLLETPNTDGILNVEVDNHNNDSDNELVTSHALNKSPRPIIEHTYNNMLNSSNNNEISSAPVTPEPEIHELKEKHLVKNILGVFSKSFPNLATSTPNKNTSEPLNTRSNEDMMSLTSDFIENSIEIEEATETTPEPPLSVQNLKKKFEKDTDIKKDVEVHSSLTARSVPKQMRQQLAEVPHEVIEEPRRHSLLSEVSIETLDTHEVIDSIDNKNNTPEEDAIVDFPKARSRIAFFEQMSQK